MNGPNAGGGGRSGGLNGAFLAPYDPGRAAPGRGVADAFRADDANGAGADELDATLQAVGAVELARRGVRPELIMDQNNLLPFDFLRTGDRLGRAVVKILRGDGAAGTGFLVAPGILLTNHHVLPDAPAAAVARALANYEANPAADPSGRSAIAALDPASLFVTNAELDFTFCGVGRLDFLGAVPLTRNSLNVDVAEYVNIIQHPRGRPKEVALQDNRVVKSDNMVVHYSCDTEPGSSGSPVFNNRWRLVALHHASVPADEAPGQAGAIPGRYLNEGIRLSAIAVWLDSLHADEANAPEHVERLRSIFAGVDPQIGFFGALGRRSEGASAAEVVVECYHAGADDLDVAFWNLRPLRARFDARAQALARVVAEMGVDVWCFSHVEAEPLQALAARLKAHFGLDFRAVPCRARVGPPVGFLVRSGGGLTAARLPDLRAPGSPHPRPCLHVRAAGGRRGDASFVVAAVAGENWARDDHPAPGPLVRAAGLPEPSDLLLLGDALRVGPPPDAPSAAGPRLASGADGALAWQTHPASRVARAYVSPNLSPIDAPPGALLSLPGRQWPPALRALRAGRPLVVRLALGDPPPVASPPPALPSLPPEVADLAGPALERVLRDLLGPIVEKILSESRR